MKSITVTTHPNIALIKYWGKRDELLFLPTKSSLSVGLDALSTTTTLTRSPNGNDVITINGEQPSPTQAKPILDFLKFFHPQGDGALAIATTNSFPTAAGLASSASGFAALTLALDAFFNLGLSPHELSALARRGSGSACRSLFGGFVIWHQGQQPDGCDSVAEQLFTVDHWPTFRIIVVVVSSTPKEISSRVAMQRSVETSPFYAQWLEESAQRLHLMHQALASKSFNLVGQLAEDDCLGMHKTMHTSTPPINFWSPTTHAIMQAVTTVRTTHGIPCYFTIDAGPNVKILCQNNDVPTILARVQKITGVLSCTTSTVARGPQLLTL